MISVTNRIADENGKMKKLSKGTLAPNNDSTST